jgi:hypothetical protein
MNPQTEPIQEAVLGRIAQEAEQWGPTAGDPGPGTQTKTQDAGGLSVFPKDAIQGFAREFSETFTEYLESPFEFWTFSCLTCLGIMLADRITLDSTLNIQPRLFTILLGQSADERKSECLKQTTGEFCETFPDRFSPCWGVGSAEGMAARLEKKPKTILVFDELKTFVSKSTIDGAILLPAVNTLFESNRFHSNTKSHSIEINNGLLSVLAATTVETYSRMWTPVFMDIGFLNRLWLVPARAEKKFAIPESLPQWKRDRLREKLREVILRYRDLNVFRVSREAKSIFSEWYADRTKSPLFGKRLDTYGHRLMTLFAANEGAGEITGDIAGRVVSLLRWQEQVRRALDPIDAESTTARMEESIRRALLYGARKERELKIKVNYSRHGLYVWKMAIQNLMAAQEISFDSKGKSYFLRVV